MSKTSHDMLGRSGLTSFDQALSILLTSTRNIHTTTETVSLLDSLNRVTSKDILSPEDLPPWPRSIMDGYAVIAADTFGASQSMPAYLNITGEIEMGKPPSGEVKKGCAYKIPTGGLVPPGADAVVMLENTVPVDESLVEIVKDVGAGTAIIQRGEDVAKGNTVIPAGKRLHPHDLGLLAGLGIDTIEVMSKPRVAILSTGDEIVHHSQEPKHGQIRDINSIAMYGLLIKCGAEPHILGVVSDSKEVFFPALEEAAKNYDIVLFSGGSSVGVRDLGEQAIEWMGNPGILVHGVSLKPGKPVIIGLHNTTPIFGLPGHPVSALVCLHSFVVPLIAQLLRKTASIIDTRASIPAKLSRNINSAPGRRDVVRATISEQNGELVAEPVLGKSGSISTLARAHGFFIIEEDSQGVYQEEIIQIHLYQ